MKRKIVFIFILLIETYPFYSKDVKSFEELRFSKIQKQKNEFDCGISVVHSILTNMYNVEVTQEEIASLIFLNSSKKLDGGISFLDIKKVFAFFSIDTEGYKISDITDISNIQLPIICHLQDSTKLKNGHFVILYEIIDDNLYILDPKFGSRIYKLYYFNKKWTGNFLILNTKFDNNHPNQQEMNKLKILDYYYNGF